MNNGIILNSVRKAKVYWLEHFSEESTINSFSRNSISKSKINIARLSKSFYLPEDLSGKMMKLTEGSIQKLFVFINAFIMIALKKYTSEDFITIGVPIQTASSEKIIPLQLSISEGDTFVEVLNKFSQQYVNGIVNQSFSIRQLSQELQLEADAPGLGVFDIAVSLSNLYSGQSILETNPTLYIEFTYESSSEIKVCFNYNSAYFMEDEIQTIFINIMSLANQLIKNLDMPLGGISFWDEEETTVFLKKREQLNSPILLQTVLSQFEEQVSRTPNHIAIKTGEYLLTYEALYAQADQVRTSLQMQGITPGMRVGVMMGRTPEVAVALFGIWKAGAIYVPLDGTLPAERLRFIIEDADIALILTKEEQNLEIPLPVPCMTLDECRNISWSGGYLDEDAVALSDPAYIIYTSGTTGQPKGVVVSHEGIANSITWRKQEYAFTTKDCILQLFAPVFDGFLTSFLAPIVAGAKVIFVDDMFAKDVLVLQRLMKEEAVTHFIAVPALFDAMLEGITAEEWSCVRIVTLAGDRVTEKTLQVVENTCPHIEIINEYGPTEGSVVATFKRDMTAETVGNIGRAIPGTQVYIMNEHLQILPAGVPGEIIIGGRGLAQQYLNRPQLTEEKFVNHPNNAIGRIYRTGDKGVWQENGEIHFLGRMDNQVKIRGYRVELGEIEQAFEKVRDVSEVVVHVHEDDLVAFYEADAQIEKQVIISTLSEKLPHYMIPTEIHFLKEIPRLSSGKIDRKALLAFYSSLSISPKHLTENMSRTEQIVREYWADILHVQPSSNSEHFFENGGHSLKGSVLLAKLSKRFNVDLTLNDLYQNPTIKELAYKIEQLEPGCHQEITPYPIQERYPISLLQKQLFVIHQMDPTSIAYNVPILVRLKGSLDVQKTTRIMQQLVKRHEVFRTSFHLKEGELYQEICPTTSLDLTVEEGTAETIHHIMRSFVQPFQLEAGSLLRINLVACNEQEWYLCLDSHHIIVDGISMRIFFQEFIAIYNGQALPEKMIDYKDYTLWCLEESQQNLIKNNTLYWQSKFGNDAPLLNFPTDFERPRIQTFNGVTLSSQLSNDETNKVHKLAKKYQVSTSLLFLSCYNILLHKYTKQQNLVVGVPISGRMRPEVEHTIGMFVHTLPIQSKLLSHQPFNTYLQNLKDQFYEDYKHQMFDFEELINSVHVIKDSSRNPLFDTVLTVHHNELEELVLNDFSYTIETFEQQMSKFDFSLDIEEVKGKTELILRYNTDLFAQETMETFLSSFHYLIEQIVASPEEPIHTYSLLNDNHITNLMVEVNNTARSYQNCRPIYRLIEEQVVKTPHYTAVVCGGKKITYEEFNQKANALATRLREKGYGKGDFIPVIMNRSIEMPLVMFAISKIGAAFCPMDPSWPIKRIETIIRDLNASILLTNAIIPINQLNIETMFIEHVQLPLVSENLKVSLKNDHIMCVIYTSGSTGVPKGVKVLNRGILNRFNWMNDEFGEYAAQSVLNTTNYVYDSALWQLFWPMINGGKTVIPLPEDSLTAEYVTQIIEQENISLTDFVPSVFDVIVQQLKEDFQYQKGLRSLQTIILGGEALTPSTVLDFLAIFPHVKPYNLYGPTEASIGCIYHQITGKEKGRIPIGRPIANTKIYLLDEQLHIVPKGVTGEIYISGICLAEGYLHDEEKTATAFIENPYAEQGYEKLYKTGDLAKILPNGEIDFLGRIDSQVKIRGLRIEMQEIERQLLLHSFIKEAVVQAVTMVQQTHLCAYITSNEEVDVYVLRKKLEEILPYYMVPTYFIQLDSIPIANSGKVDKKALPLPTIQKHKHSQNISPSNELEVAIYDIWKKIIVTDDFGVHDNFFELGGDSIKALQLISHLKSIHLKCTLQQVFLNPTIAELSKIVKQEETKVIAQKPIVGEVSLTPIQRRFFTVQDPQLHFNQAILLESKETIDLTVLQQALDKLITHHDALRLQFKWTSSAIHQENLPVGEGFYSIEQVNLQDVTALATQLKQEASRIQQSISLTTGPLMKVAVMKAQEGDFILFAIHHLVVDGVSWRILMEDFIHLYDQAMQGQSLTLPEKTVSYQEWAEALQAYSTSKILWKEARYWEEQESKIVPALPKDKDMPLGTYAEMGSVSMQLDSEWTARLLREAPKAYQTEINDLLLAALGLAMNKWSGTDSIRVDLEGHGREELERAYDLSRTVGWFTSIYPVVLDFTKVGDLSYFIRSVKETLRKVPSKGLGYGVFKYGMAEKPQWMRSTDAEISFNYLGQIDIPQADEISGFSLSQQSLDGYRSEKADNLYTLDINSQILQGRLVFKVDYASKQYEESTMNSFISLVKSSLQEIISHCISVDRTTLTPSDVGATALTLEEFKLIEEQVHGVIKKVYPLSPMQEGMLFHHVMNSKAKSYFEQNRLRIHGTIDEDIFRKSYQYLLDRYDIFKTAFIYNRLRQPMQVVLDKRQGEVHYRDISHLSPFAQEAEMEELLAADKTRGFDLENEVLLRAYIIKLDKEVYEVIWSEHHILMDGWCLAIVMKEFMAIYNAFAQGQSPILEDVVPYEVFIHWLSEQDQEEAKSYWKEKLNDFTTPLVVSHSTANSNQPEYIQETVKLILSKSLTCELEAIAKQYGVTVNTIFQSIWSIFLRKLNQTDDILFGTVVSGRTADIAKIETMVGLFINTIPLRLTINKELSFKDLVQKVQHEILEAEEYSYYPLASIQSETSLGNALINHIVVFENHPLQMEMQQLKDNSSTPFQIQEVEAFEQTNYDFNVVVLPNEAFEINFVFNANVYSKKDVEQIRTSLHLLIESVTTCQDALVRDLNIVSNEQYEQMYSLLNDTEATFPIEETILSVFETQVKLHPSAIAIVEGEQQLTYSDLNAKANQVARFMTQAHVKPQEIVGILLDSSIDMIISILATLKCGAIYLPIDPTYPKERITYMMEDSQLKVVLTKESYCSSCAANVNILLVHDLAINQLSKENFGCTLNSSDVAYIIYTSGTTGQPKGVEVTHRNVVRLLFNSSMQFDFSNKDVWTVFHSFCFDFSVWEMYGALLYGGKLIVIPKQIARDTEAFHQLLINEKVTVLNQTPTAFLNLSQIEMEQASAKLSLRYIIFGGEALKPIILKKWAMRYSNTKFINMYGITETTVHVTYKEIGLEEIEQNESNIGKPIPTLRVYILDQDMQPVPVGVPGELYVAGEGVTKGYLNRQELTNDRFISHSMPISTNKHRIERLYRSGDIVKVLPNGELSYIGRRDEQVKIRGHRIEINEIILTLLKHSEVEEAIVVAKQLQNNQLSIVAYYVSSSGTDIQDLRDYLKQCLPFYMLPNYFMRLDTLPLTSNGKVDKNTLPNPIEHMQLSHSLEKPVDEKEAKLVMICEEVLGIPSIGLEDNYFALGGDSIKALQIYSRLRQHHLKLEIKDIFENPVIKDMSRKIKEETYVICREVVKGEVPLTPIQRRFFTVQDPQLHFNQSILLESKETIDLIVLQQVLDKLITHHDALRLQFKWTSSAIHQENLPIGEGFYSIEQVDLQDVTALATQLEQEASRIQQSISLTTGPLMKVAVMKAREGDFILFAIHHLVVDGVSWRILMEDFIHLYDQAMQGQSLTLPEKTVSYQEWAEALQAYSTSKKLWKEARYWEEQESKIVPALPKDKDMPLGTYAEMGSVSMQLDSEWTARLLREAPKAYQTEINDLLLAALGLAMNKWSGTDSIRVDLEGHGREELDQAYDLSRTVGWFTSIYPVVLDFTKVGDLSYYIRSVKETLRKVPSKGLGYGVFKYGMAEKPQWMRSTDAEISFNYLGQTDLPSTESKWEMSTFPLGEVGSKKLERLYAIDISGKVLNSHLTITIDYSQPRYNEETMTQLLTYYQESLLEILNCCIDESRPRRTPSDIGNLALSLETFDELEQKIEGSIVQISNMTPMQQGMLYHAKLDPSSHAYFEQASLQLLGHVQFDKLEACYRLLINKYETFRTLFIIEQVDLPCQVIVQEVEDTIRFIDLQHLQADLQQEALLQLLLDDRNAFFDFKRAPLTRMMLVQFNENRYQLIWSFHHMVLDGWSMGIVMKEFFEMYEKALREESLPSSISSNVLYMDWLNEQDPKEAQEFWKEYLADFNTLSILPYEKSTPSSVFVGKEFVFTFGKERTNQLKTLAETAAVTLNSVIQAGWGVLLQKYNATQDVVFGSVVSGRPPTLEQVEQLVGLFINTIPVRVKGSEKITFNELVQQIQKSFLHAEPYCYYPLYEIQTRQMNGNPLIHHVIAFENYPVEKGIQEISDQKTLGFEVEEVKMFEQINYAFGIVVIPSVDDMTIKFTYNGGVFTDQAIANIREHFIYILDQVIQKVDLPLNSIELLSLNEQSQRIDGQKGKSIASLQTVLSQFEEQVSRTPNHIAIKTGEYLLTYEALYAQADQVRTSLQMQGITPGMRVGVMMGRTPEVAVALFGIWKAGAIYVPLDGTLPAERLRFIIEDADIALILTKEEQNLEIPLPVPCMTLDECRNISWSGGYLDEDAVALSDPAYIIYTSGTTGQPKGVVVSHEGIANSITWRKQEYAFTTKDCILQLFAPVFDGFLTSFLAPIVAGAKVIFVDDMFAKDVLVLQRLMKEEAVTHFIAVPALFDAMLEGITAEEWSCVRIVTLAGDRVTEKTLQVVENTCPHIEIINEYGPTEGSVVATFKRDMTAETVGNIGRAIPGTQVYIMNEHLQILPAGVPGEIIIGGRGLAQQYLNRPQLTEEKFVNHPNIAIGRIYRTGDKGVWQENGEIHFLGRMDNQVKIRGYRVELGEIERAFEKISGVNEVAALILDENNKMLVLSYTGDAKLTEAYMRHFATQHLPNYMIPSAFYHLGTLPYTKTGKLDREQLKHVINQIASSTEHNDQHTMSETEEKLTIIWAEKLNHQFFNRHDHFFEIGGNSIKLMQVQTAIKQIFDKEISVADLFAHPTISQLATFIEQGIPEVIVENLEIEIEIEMEEQLTDIIEALDRGDLSFEHALKSLEKLEDDYDK